MANRVKARMIAQHATMKIKNVSWKNKLTQERFVISSDEEEQGECKPSPESPLERDRKGKGVVAYSDSGSESDHDHYGDSGAIGVSGGGLAEGSIKKIADWEDEVDIVMETPIGKMKLILSRKPQWEQCLRGKRMQEYGNLSLKSKL